MSYRADFWINSVVGILVSLSVFWFLTYAMFAHCKLHSPTGFEVGSSGSGPADTAASILADYFDESPCAVEHAWRGRSNRFSSFAIKLHQSFKTEVITGIGLEPGEIHMLDEEQITAWLVEKHPEYLKPLESVTCPVCGDTLWREPDIFTTAEAWQDAVREFNRAHEHHAKMSKTKEHEPWITKSL